MKLTGTQNVRLYKATYDDKGLFLRHIPVGSEPRIVTLAIRDTGATINDFQWEVNNTIEERKYKVKFSKPVNPDYHKGIDNSGGHYEYLTFIDYDAPRKWASTYKGYHQVWEEFNIQTWDRKELFVTFRFIQRPYTWAKYENLEIETVIFTLDDKSANTFNKFLNHFSG